MKNAIATAEPRPGVLNFGPLGPRCVHICVDMQRMFAEETPWRTPWMARVTPNVERLAAAHPQDTIFTRFIPAPAPGMGAGVWARYWRRWRAMTREELPAGLMDLTAPLARLTPPAAVIDKAVYSPWFARTLDLELRRRRTDTLLITGAETDVCVLATVLGAVDRGYRVILITDALCNSSDEAHDASLKVYHTRYSQQIETIDTAAALAAWAEPPH
jgi:nicotinamidase-related amidase